LLIFVSVLKIGYSQTVVIGSQVWCNKNLEVSKFRNGDPIPEVKSNEAWEKAGEYEQPAWCYYNYDSANGIKYGKFYNWYAVIDPRGLSPLGYHVPTDDEWTELSDFLGGKQVAGKILKMETILENEIQIGGWNGNNLYGFSALPGGFGFYFGGFDFMVSHGYFWSSTEGSENSAYTRLLSGEDDVFVRASYFKGGGLSVRCLKD
jgi:uncharacterized protein (TIGR02145 family)